MAAEFFEGFEARQVDVGEATLFMRRKGAGEAVLLLHGFPQTHLMWHHIAPALTDCFTVVCADLRGYGGSSTPRSTPDHAPYAKRAMAGDMVRLMVGQGFERFHVVGHDRGARVAYRLALDHPDHVRSLTLLDILPTAETLDRADARLAMSFWPWSLLAQPSPLPERMVQSNPEAVVDDALSQWGSDPQVFSAQVRRAYADALRSPPHVHAICEEYRAASTLDARDDRQDRAAGHKIAAPTLVLWSKRSALDTWYADAGGPLGIWQLYADQVEGHAVEGGHFFPEQNPSETLDALIGFLGRSNALQA